RRQGAGGRRQEAGGRRQETGLLPPASCLHTLHLRAQETTTTPYAFPEPCTSNVSPARRRG
ncbi:MAG: hypothetical protein WCK70_08445, partial [Chloroflexales bacterium]